jgi:outer membrane protein assembly factor BamB
MIMYGDATVSAVSLETGKTLWTLGDAEYQEGFITSRGDLVQSYIDHANEFRYTVALIDVRTGRVSVIWTAPVDQNRVLWPQFSSDGVVVIGSTSVDEALDEGQASASALDLSTGELTVGALTITIAGG